MSIKTKGYMNFDTAILCCFFNPTDSKNRISNLTYFLNFIEECGLRDHLYLCEILFDGQESVVPNKKNLINLRTSSILWHKESGFNILFQNLPKEYTKILYCDTDVIWKNKKWCEETSRLLNHYSAVQPFSKIYFLTNPNGIDSPICHHDALSFPKRYLDEGSPMGTTGFCWGFNREKLDRVGGFYTKCLVGAGDIMTLPYLSIFEGRLSCRSLIKEITTYRNAFIKEMNFRMSYLDEECFHLYHGSLKNRKYTDKWKLIENVDFYKNFSFDGKLWSCINQELQKNITDFFFIRKEDEKIENDFIKIIDTQFSIVEKDSASPKFKWMSDKAQFKLQNASKVILEMDKNGNTYTADNVSIHVNGEKLFNSPIPATIEIPLTSSTALVELKFDKWFVPSEHFNTDDNRKLAAVLRNVQIEDLSENKIPIDLSSIQTELSENN